MGNPFVEGARGEVGKFLLFSNTCCKTGCAWHLYEGNLGKEQSRFPWKRFRSFTFLLWMFENLIILAILILNVCVLKFFIHNITFSSWTTCLKLLKSIYLYVFCRKINIMDTIISILIDLFHFIYLLALKTKHEFSNENYIAFENHLQL